MDLPRGFANRLEVIECQPFQFGTQLEVSRAIVDRPREKRVYLLRVAVEAPPSNAARNGPRVERQDLFRCRSFDDVGHTHPELTGTDITAECGRF